MASVTFCVPDKPGALLNVLDILRKHEINLQKLESRPILGKPWEYSFFLELEIKDVAGLDDVVALVKEQTTGFRILGYYTKAH